MIKNIPWPLLLITLFSSPALAQQVYSVDAAYKASGNEGRWFFTDAAYKADKLIFFTEAAYQADLLIYFVDAEYKSGWRQKEKMQLMY